MSTTTQTDEFVTTPAAEPASIIVRAGALADILTAVSLVAKSRDTKFLPMLHSAHFEIRDGSLVVTSTDRLRMIQATAEGTTEGTAVGVAPSEFLEKVKKVMGKVKKSEHDDLVTVTLTDSQITLANATQSLTGDLIPGDYPKVQSILDSDHREPLGRVGFNPGFLQDLTKMGFPPREPLVLEFSGPGRPVHTFWETHRFGDPVVKFHHVLMPVRPPEPEEPAAQAPTEEEQKKD